MWSQWQVKNAYGFISMNQSSTRKFSTPDLHSVGEVNPSQKRPLFPLGAQLISLRKRISTYVAIATIGIAAASAIPAASADTQTKDQPWSKTETIYVNDFSTNGVFPKSAGGTTWGPGGFGAQVSIQVNGSGLHVDNAAVSYNVGAAPGNACVDSFEIAYWQGGARKTQSTGTGHCTPMRVSHTFQVNQDMDHNSKFCGSVVTGGSRSGYACVKITR